MSAQDFHFYRPAEGHGLPHSPSNAIIAPRPIGWISTLDAEGRPNLAPYSFFNAVAYHPFTVMFSATGPHPTEGTLKHSAGNALTTGEFVCNLTTEAQKAAVVATAAHLAAGEDEFAAAGLETLPSTVVKPPRVKGAPVHLECRTVHHWTTPQQGDIPPSTVIFGEVVGVHIDRGILVDGLIDLAKVRPLARLGYKDYAVITEPFSIERPD